MKKATIIGLAMAGLAWWLGSRAGSKNDGVGSPRQGKAHTAGGDDASASFNAGIADENTIPDVMPAV